MKHMAMGILAVLAVSAGCVSRTDALLVSQLGLDAVQTSRTLLQNVQSNARESSEWFEISAAIGDLRLDAEKIPAARQQYRNDIKKYVGSLDARIEMLDELGRAYAALHDLAAYDFPGAVSVRAKDLASSIIAYSNSSTAQPVNDALVRLIENAAAAFAEAVQQRELFRANSGFAALLQATGPGNEDVGVIPALRAELAMYAKDAETGNIRQRILDGMFGLISTGLATPAPILNEMTANRGLSIDAKRLGEMIQSSAASAGNPGVVARINPLLADLLEYRAKRNDELQIQGLEASIQAFDALHKQHVKLQDPQHVSVAELQEALAHLRAISTAARDFRIALDNARAAEITEGGSAREEWLKKLRPLIEAIAARLGVPVPPAP